MMLADLLDEMMLAEDQKKWERFWGLWKRLQEAHLHRLPYGPLYHIQRPTTTPGQPADALSLQRGASHGDYTTQAGVAEMIKRIYHGAPRWNDLSPEQKFSLDMDAAKTSRILVGDPNMPDHWADKAGYATLITQRLEKCQ